MPKITKIVHKHRLAGWMKECIAPPLVVHRHDEGYGGLYIEQDGTGWSFPWCRRHRVGRIDGNQIDVLDPSWFSTLEDYLAKWEAYSGETATLVIHEHVLPTCLDEGAMGDG